MNNNQEILDLFGVYVVSQVYDDSMKYLKELIEGSTKWGTRKEYTDVFQKLSPNDRKVLYLIRQNEMYRFCKTKCDFFVQNEMC